MVFSPRRGQSTIELITIVAVAIVVLAVLVDFTAEQVNYLQKQQAVKSAELAVQLLVSTANEVYTQGPGATRYVQLAWPAGVQSDGTGIQDHSIVINVFETYISGTAIPSLTGTLPTNAGLQNIRVRAFDGFVTIGEMDFSADPSTIFSSLSRDSNDSISITLSSFSSEDATITLSSTWSHDDVNVATGPSGGTLSAGSTYLFDVNFFTSASAVGTYTGKIIVTATFPSNVQTLVIPAQVNVNTNNSSLLVAFPASISLSTFGIDTNHTTIQLCNVSTTAMKTVSITPSSGEPGAWLHPFSTIDTLDAQSCQTIDINVDVPTDSISPYVGSLHISDYSGANSRVVPLTINVLGMNSVFRWDWSTAYKSVQSIFDFSIANVGRKPVTLTQITLRDWWTCDSQLSRWNSLVINTTSRFIGSLPDGNTADVTDFNIPVLTSYSNNSLSFSGDIQDNNEPFTAVVDFSDGTQYVSSTFGSPDCPPDITPPAKISDLSLRPGPEPESMILSFTLPGDDGNTGRIYGMDMRITPYVYDSIDDYNTATPIAYTGPVDFGDGGTTYSQVISDYDVGTYWWLAIQTVDENGNYSPVSNVVVDKPWGQFSFVGDDFNFSNFVETYGGIAPISPGDGSGLLIYDVNFFTLHSIQGPVASYRRLVFSVYDENTPTNSWTIAFDMNQTDINRYLIWDGENPLSGGFSSTPSDYNAAVSWPIGNTVDLLSTSAFPTNFRYNNTSVDLHPPLTFLVIEATNITDFNIAADMGAAIVETCQGC